jgi:hypothetical protein
MQPYKQKRGENKKRTKDKPTTAVMMFSCSSVPVWDGGTYDDPGIRSLLSPSNLSFCMP